MQINNEVLVSAETVHHIFSGKDGSSHIATISSLYNILVLTKTYDFSLVVDIGSGIGTISYLVLENTNLPVISYETNSWCIEHQMKNLKECRNYNLHTSIDEFLKSLDKEYFLIIDDYLSWKNLIRILSRTPKVIFIEGYRNKQVAMISFYLLLKNIPSEFNRSDLHKSLNEKKSGSFFLIEPKNNFYLSLRSWYKRIRKTKEFKEFLLAAYFIFRRLISIRSRIYLVKSIFYRNKAKHR